MKIYSETSLVNFKFWCGAKDNVEIFTDRQLEQIEAELELLYPDGISEIELNDLFWFDIDWLKELVGIEEEEEEEEEEN